MIHWLFTCRCCSCCASAQGRPSSLRFRDYANLSGAVILLVRMHQLGRAYHNLDVGVDRRQQKIT